MDEARGTQQLEMFEGAGSPLTGQEAVLSAILDGIATPQKRRPLNCVTFKQPLPEYLALKRVSKRWHLRYSDIIRLFLSMAVAVLDNPSSTLLERLERHRDSELERIRLREQARGRKNAA